MTDQIIHRLNGVTERICEHGVGHPIEVPYDVNGIKLTDDQRSDMTIHGCDGCCSQ